MLNKSNNIGTICSYIYSFIDCGDKNREVSISPPNLWEIIL